MTGLVTRRDVLGTAAGVAAGLTVVGAAAAGCRSEPPPEPEPEPSPAATFDDAFRFGVATSAYQIEGAATADGRGPSIWDTFAATPGRIDDGSSGAVACDHYRRWESDLDLIAGLGVQSYRFSVAWPRVLPRGRGQVNVKGLDFYKKLVAGLRQRGIAPVVTLYHWDLPQSLQDAGGWGQRDSANWFADYAEVVFGALDGVEIWLTVNEPKIVVEQGYQRGWMAPGLTDLETSGRVLHHLGLAHGRAVQAFRASGRSGRIGPCPVVTTVYPVDASAEAQVETADLTENRLYLDPILRGRYPDLRGLDTVFAGALERSVRDGDLAVLAAPVDLLGLNYYTPTVIDAAGRPQQIHPVATNQWQQVYPEALRATLVRLSRDYRLPLLVCENGVPDASGEDGVDDPSRVAFLREHLLAVRRAIDEGAMVEGYHAWSLLDNFEWARGYTQRWGLVRVDFETQARTRKASADWYAEVARTHTLT